MTPDELADTIARYIRERPDQFKEALAWLTEHPGDKVPDPFQMRRERDEQREEARQLRMKLERYLQGTEEAHEAALALSGRRLKNKRARADIERLASAMRWHDVV